ncbi:MAG: hypothetical protein JWN44_1964 [Myxococcales bacterium]|nr:hypothetical protein [Myxococcales bacterium]
MDVLCAHLKATHHPPLNAREAAVVDGIFAPEVTRQRISAAFHAWLMGDRVFRIERPSWGRIWLVALLAHMAPSRSVLLADSIRDPTMIHALTSRLSFSDRFDIDSVARALLRSSSCFCRALAIQAMAAPLHRASFGNTPDVPADPLALIRRLRVLGVGEESLAQYCGEWLRARPKGSQLHELCAAISDVIPKVGPVAIPELLANAFEADEHAVAAATESTRTWPYVLQSAYATAFIDLIARKWTGFENGKPTAPRFDGRAWRIILTFGQIVSAHFDLDARTAVAALEQAMGVRDLMKFMRPMSPLHRRRDIDDAAKSLGMALFTEISTASFCVDDGLSVREDLTNRLYDLLETFGPDLDEQYVSCAVQLLFKRW